MLLHLLPSTSLRSPPPLLHRPPPELRLATASLAVRQVTVRCSISQSRSYGTVDHEKRRVFNWRPVYWRLSHIEDPKAGAAGILSQWDQEEKRLTKWGVCRVAKELRKFRRFKLALDVYEWMAAQKERFTFHSSDAAILLDLISKVRGVASAEEYFAGLSEALIDRRTYCALLNAYANAKLKGKAEAVLETIKNKGYARDALVCNVIMTMYMNLQEHENVVSIIKEMREKNIKFDTYSYNIWITSCASIGNVEEMERILELMEADQTVNVNWTTYCTLAAMLIRLGEIDKAETYIKEAESRLTGSERISFNFLIGLYGLIGKMDDVYRVWDWYKSSFSNMLNSGYQAMLSSLINLGDISGAETIYGEWLSTATNYDPKICNVLLSYYVKNGQIRKAEKCVEELREKGGIPYPTTLEILTQGYISEKQTSKALSCLTDAAAIKKPLVKMWRPRPETVSGFLDICRQQNDSASMESLIKLLKEMKCLHDSEYKSLVSLHAKEAVEGGKAAGVQV